MKKNLALLPITLCALLLTGGCVAAIGNGAERGRGNGTLGQQLIDLQKAKETGAITEAEFQAEKARVLNHSK